MSPDLIVQFVSTVGFPIALACYFIWRDWHREVQTVERERESIAREKRMADRITALEEAMASEFADMLNRATRAIESNTELMQRMGRVIERSEMPNERRQ